MPLILPIYSLSLSNKADDFYFDKVLKSLQRYFRICFSQGISTLKPSTESAFDFATVNIVMLNTINEKKMDSSDELFIMGTTLYVLLPAHEKGRKYHVLTYV